MSANTSQGFHANQLKRMDLELKKIDDDETEIAEQLKRLCDKYGRETDPKASAVLLHKLAKIYRMRSPDMFSLIRSAALFNAAAVRSPKNKREIINDLRQLCKHVLEVADAENRGADLIHQSKTVKKTVKNMRDQVDDKLQEVKPIPNNVEKDELHSLEQEKIFKLQYLQDNLAKQYTQIMAGIAEYCESVMGPAPCKFAVAGMGSLARKEITPYSDFEHIILLENAEKQNNDYEQCLKYFRWFSVIFQIIVINLGETIIPSVAINSLNDQSVEKGNWFYDAFTMRGVSFDGMMPHASKFPLGRRQLTEQKPWMTELIKPVNDMLQYLSGEESLKNGYHLNDILTKTCFVYKNKQVFNEFQQKMFRYLEIKGQKQSGEEFVKKQLIEDLQKFAARPTLAKLKPKQSFNIKQVFYRSVTLFIMSLGRIYNINSLSCYDILIGLVEKQQIKKYAQHKLMYAVALACEIRLKWYSMNKSQRDDVPSITEIVKIIGEFSTASYFQITYSLQSEVSKRLQLKKAHFYSNPYFLNLNIGYCLGNHRLQETSAKLTKASSSDERLYSFDDCLRLLTDEFKIHDSLTESEGRSKNGMEHVQAMRYMKLGNDFYGIKSYDDAIECYKKSTEVFSKLLNSFNEKNEDNNKSQDLIKQLAKNNRSIGQSFLYMYKPHDAFEHLQIALKMFEQSSLDINNDIEVAATLYDLGHCLWQKSLYTNAKHCLDESLQIRERISEDVDRDRGIANTLQEIGGCLTSMNKLEEAKGYFERSLEILKIFSGVDTDYSVAVVTRKLGNCLMEMKKLDEARIHFNVCLENLEQMTQRNDRQIAFTLLCIGRCLVERNDLEEAQRHLDRALKIMEQISIDINNDRGAAIILNDIGCCLMEMNKLDEAKHHLDKCLKIGEQISIDINTDCDVATTLRDISRCLMKMNKPHEAKRHSDRAAEIEERIANKASDVAENVSTPSESNHASQNAEVENAKFLLDSLSQNDETVENNGNTGVLTQTRKCCCLIQ